MNWRVYVAVYGIHDRINSTNHRQIGQAYAYRRGNHQTNPWFGNANEEHTWYCQCKYILNIDYFESVDQRAGGVSLWYWPLCDDVSTRCCVVYVCQWPTLEWTLLMFVSVKSHSEWLSLSVSARRSFIHTYRAYDGQSKSHHAPTAVNRKSYINKQHLLTTSSTWMWFMAAAERYNG